MTFQEVLDFTGYSEVYLAECLLNRPDSRPARQAEKLGYIISDEDKKYMVRIKTDKRFRNSRAAA